MLVQLSFSSYSDQPKVTAADGKSQSWQGLPAYPQDGSPLVPLNAQISLKSTVDVAIPMEFDSLGAPCNHVLHG